MMLSNGAHNRYGHLIGRTWARLTLESILGRGKEKRIEGYFLCSCGRHKSIPISRVVNAVIASCGCLTKDTKPNFIHGMRYTKEYRAWRGIKERCHKLSSKDYAKYGGNGIKMAVEWRNDFTAFFAYIGKAPSLKHQVDRINNTKGYIPKNIRWATHTQNARNKSNSYTWTVKGVNFDSINDAAKFFKVSAQTISRWCHGYKDFKTNKPIIKRDDCCAIKKY